ncbi:OFA family MFS transporter, partial [Escherichia coli]|uniref:OFA family MFS transporter n=1 Tax=Escherichia coli TaxID=562 RepID=UPI0013D33574
AMGVIYAWGVFSLPLESYLAVSRAELSSVPTAALISFTAGMVAHDRLLRILGRVRLSILAFALTGAGHLLFAAVPAYWALIAGYGLVFGLG